MANWKKETSELVASSQVIVITSGKGGVGKTTSSAAIACGIALKGFKTVIVDFDVGLRNLDLVMGCERWVVYDFINVANQEVELSKALIRDKHIDNLFILPTSQTRDKDALTLEGVATVIDQLKSQFDYIICDSPAGIEKGATMAMHFADQAIIVTNPEVSSVRDSDRILGILSSHTHRAQANLAPVQEHLLITRYHAQRVANGEMMSVDDIVEILSVPLLGVIPESPAILRASNTGVPVIHDQASQAGQAYMDAVERFLGHNTPMRFIEPQSKLLGRLFRTLFKRTNPV